MIDGTPPGNRQAMPRDVSVSCYIPAGCASARDQEGREGRGATGRAGQVLRRLLRSTGLAVLRAVTAILRPFRRQVVAFLRLCRREDLLLLNDWEGEVTPLVLAQKGPERFVVDARDMTIGSTVRATGGFDFEKFEKVLTLLPPGFKLGTLYDIGANIGVICIPAVARGLAARAVAFEPAPGNFRLLVANAHINGMEGAIACHNVALGPEDGQTLEFELAGTNYGDHRVRVTGAPGSFGESQREVIQVSAGRFDTFVTDIDPANSLLWMDVQGYEGQVLDGAQAALATGVRLVTEVWPYGLRRCEGLEAFRRAVGRYDHFYDLDEPSPQRQPVAALDALIARLGEGGASTDILLC
jgi:FkbM family methyltransferase